MQHLLEVYSQESEIPGSFLGVDSSATRLDQYFPRGTDLSGYSRCLLRVRHDVEQIVRLRIASRPEHPHQDFLQTDARHRPVS